MTRYGRYVNKPKTYSQDLSAGPLLVTTDFRSAVRIESLLFHVSEAITENWTITIDRADGSTYDTVIRTGSFYNSTDATFMPDGEFYLNDGDQLKIECTNANVTGIIYLTVNWSEA